LKFTNNSNTLWRIVLAVIANLKPVPLGKVREQVDLIGNKDGNNRVFILPEKAIHNPPYSRIKIYFDTRRLQDTEYIAEESAGPGTGFDKITFTYFSPKFSSSIFADYLAL